MVHCHWCVGGCDLCRGHQPGACKADVDVSGKHVEIYKQSIGCMLVQDVCRENFIPHL